MGPPKSFYTYKNAVWLCTLRVNEGQVRYLSTGSAWIRFCFCRKRIDRLYEKITWVRQCNGQIYLYIYSRGGTKIELHNFFLENPVVTEHILQPKAEHALLHTKLHSITLKLQKKKKKKGGMNSWIKTNSTVINFTFCFSTPWPRSWPRRP